MSPLLAFLVMIGAWAQAHPTLIASLGGTLLLVGLVQTVRVGLRTHRRF